MITITYTTSVLTAAGWRPVTICAEAEKMSAAMARVVRVLTIDGNEPTGYTSRTGANRQRYNAAGIARREVGTRKRISACKVLAAA